MQPRRLCSTSFGATRPCASRSCVDSCTPSCTRPLANGPNAGITPGDGIGGCRRANCELAEAGRLIFTPLMQKRNRMAEARSSLRSRCEYWFTQYLPGVFSANPFAARFPACEFVTLSKGSPFTDSEERNRYIELLGLDRAYEAWRCE